MNNIVVYDLNLYKMFHVASLCKSFSEAASRLNITQPAISHSIKSLEEQLDVQLFIRSNNGIELTKEGRALLFYIEKANNLVLSGNKVVNELKAELISEINVGVPTHIGAYYFIKYLKLFNEKYPNVRVNIIDKKTSEMMLMIESKELDIMIDTDLIESWDKNIKVVKLKDLTGCFIGNASFEMLSKKEKITASELNMWPLALPSSTTTTRKIIDSYFRCSNVSLVPIIETNSSPIARSIIESGLGIGWMIQEFVQDEIDNFIFFPINVDVDSVKIPISIAYQEKHLNLVLIDFINIFKNN